MKKIIQIAIVVLVFFSCSDNKQNNKSNSRELIPEPDKDLRLKNDSLQNTLQEKGFKTRSKINSKMKKQENITISQNAVNALVFVKKKMYKIMDIKKIIEENKHKSHFKEIA